MLIAERVDTEELAYEGLSQKSKGLPKSLKEDSGSKTAGILEPVCMCT